MRVALVHSFYSSSVPSGENRVVGLQIEALRAAGHVVQLFAARTDELSKSKLFTLKTAINVASGHGIDPTEQLKEFRPDIVHVHNLFPNFGTKWLADWDGPIVATSHNFRPICANGTLFRDLHACYLCPEKGQIHAVINKCYKQSSIATIPLAIRNTGGLANDKLFARADKIVFLSDRARNQYEIYGISSQKSTIVPNFVEDSLVPHNPSSKSKSWVYIGRLSEEKGIRNLIKYWPKGTMLEIFGSGPLLDSIKTQIAPRDEITLHGNIVHSQVMETLSEAVGLVLPSLWAEGIPTVYLEAISKGIPVLARNGNSAADDIVKWAPSLVYSNDSELRIKISETDSNRDLLSSDAMSHYSQNYTASIWVERIVRVYEETVRSRDTTQR